ncbi:MAG: hypothetical protein ABSB18_00655 [Candidatus Omnitrophota bacterium]
MNYPFLQKQGNILSVRLNKELYPQDLIERAIKEEPAGIHSFRTQKQYHLVRLKEATSEDCLAFLNYLIYLNRK